MPTAIAAGHTDLNAESGFSRSVGVSVTQGPQAPSIYRHRPGGRNPTAATVRFPALGQTDICADRRRWGGLSCRSTAVAATASGGATNPRRLLGLAAY